MYCSLEARVPLLDHNVVEFGINIDSKLKIKNGTSKYILKQILYDYLPKEIMNRPKRGFTIPLADWLLNKSSPLMDLYLNDDIVNEIGIIDTNFVKTLKTKFINGEKHLFNKVWSLIVLNHFLINNHFNN